MIVSRTAMAVVLAIGVVGVTSTTANASSTANWVTYRYGLQTQADITCGAGVICEVELARGESLKGGQFVGDAISGAMGSSSYEMWQHNSFIEGNGDQQRPHLTFVASKPGLVASAVVATDRHLYRFLLHSIASTRPTYVSFVYPAHPRSRTAFSARLASKPVSQAPAPTPIPMDPLSQMNRACDAMPKGDVYGSSPTPAQWRPYRVCHSADRTFVQLQPIATVPVDLPIPREVTTHGDANVVWTYDSSSRVYGIDLVPNEIVLTLGDGKNQMRMRIQRQTLVAPKASQPIAVTSQ